MVLYRVVDRDDGIDDLVVQLDYSANKAENHVLGTFRFIVLFGIERDNFCNNVIVYSRKWQTGKYSRIFRNLIVRTCSVQL